MASNQSVAPRSVSRSVATWSLRVAVNARCACVGCYSAVPFHSIPFHSIPFPSPVPSTPALTPHQLAAIPRLMTSVASHFLHGPFFFLVILFISSFPSFWFDCLIERIQVDCARNQFDEIIDISFFHFLSISSVFNYISECPSVCDHFHIKRHSDPWDVDVGYTGAVQILNRFISALTTVDNTAKVPHFGPEEVLHRLNTGTEPFIAIIYKSMK